MGEVSIHVKIVIENTKKDYKAERNFYVNIHLQDGEGVQLK